MSMQPTWTPMPDELANLTPPTREDAIERMEWMSGTWGIRKSSLFEATSVGQRCANGEYGTGDFCKEAKAKHDATRERNIEASLEALTKQYDENLQRKQRLEEQNAAALAVETEKLKARWMEAPGATEAGFQAALPELLTEQQRRQALDGTSAYDRAVESMRGRFSI